MKRENRPAEHPNATFQVNEQQWDIYLSHQNIDSREMKAAGYIKPRNYVPDPYNFPQDYEIYFLEEGYLLRTV